MKKLGFLTVALAGIIALAGAVWAQEPKDPCPGDCNMDLDVTVDETVVAVNIGLGYDSIDNCENLDVDGNGTATIDEIVDSTLSLLTRCGRNPGYCGNGVTETSLGEECDDGGICVGGPNELEDCTRTDQCPDGECKPVGADGCAINCTFERLRQTNLSSRAQSVVQQATFPITINLQGYQGYTTGKALDVEVKGPQGEVITRPGDYPVAIKPADVFFEPVRVTGLVCACVRQIEVPTFGPGNSAVGVIACGEDGIDDISYKLVQDHVTNPGSAMNGNTPPMIGEQLADDPQCDAAFIFPGSGVVSDACLEGTDELCMDPDERGQHPGLCNSPRNITFFGPDGPGTTGNFPRGNALINNSTAIGLLNDGGLCRTNLEPGDPGCFTDYGPDCKPCTDDDADLGDPENLPTTTGLAWAAVFDATTEKGRTIDVVEPRVTCATTADCESGQRCLRQCALSGTACSSDQDCAAAGDSCPAEANCSWNGCGTGNFLSRCIVRREGRPFDCDALAADDTPDDHSDGDGLSGGALAVSFPSIDALRIGDNVTASVLDLE